MPAQNVIHMDIKARNAQNGSPAKIADIILNSAWLPITRNEQKIDLSI